MVPIKSQLANKANYGGTRSLNSIKWIVLHYTANDGDSDENNATYFQRNVVKTSAHYFVDDDSITQSVPDNYVAWAVGGGKLNSHGKYHGQCTNSNSISIELCDNVRNGVVYPTRRTIENAIDLTKMLMAKYNIDINRVIRHRDVTGKECPKFWIDDSKWQQEFKKHLVSLDYSSVFNADYYSNTYADLKSAFGNDGGKLFDHFMTYGMKEGRQAHPQFNVFVYKERYLDLQNAFGNNLPLYYKHFIEFGIKEGRKAI